MPKGTQELIDQNVTDLGCITNIEVIEQFVALEGKRVVDAGCGNLGFSRQVAEAGARVLAIDPDPVQAELNRNAAAIANVEFVEAGANAIPVADGMTDGVFFSYSLHHIPQEIYEQVFREVFRVLKADGFLYVIEPIDCPLNQVMRLFHNEDRERAAAQQALREFAVPTFQSVVVVTYHSYSTYDSFDQFATYFGNKSFNTHYNEADVRRDEVREAFERLGGAEHRFQSPKQVMCLKNMRSR